MGKKPDTPRPTKVARATLPRVLGKPLPPFTKLRGASPFAAALEYATKEQVDKARQLAGGLDANSFIRYHKVADNPVWLWMALSVSANGEIPSEVLVYMRSCAKRLFAEVIGQVTELERVKIEAGQTPEEGIVRQPRRPRDVASLGELFGLSRAGQNPFKTAASDFRAISMAVAAESLIREKGCSHNEACARLAIVNGRVSPGAGPAVETMRRMVRRGRKLTGLAQSRRGDGQNLNHFKVATMTEVVTSAGCGQKRRVSAPTKQGPICPVRTMTKHPRAPLRFCPPARHKRQTRHAREAAAALHHCRS